MARVQVFIREEDEIILTRQESDDGKSYLHVQVGLFEIYDTWSNKLEKAILDLKNKSKV